MKDRIKQIRKELKLTQAEFGEKIGVKGNTVTGYESGIRSPSDAIVVSICREFCVNEVWLRTGEGEPFREESREEQILRAATQTVRSSNEFRKQVAFLLAQLSESDWEVLGNIYKKLDENKKNERA